MLKHIPLILCLLCAGCRDRAPQRDPVAPESSVNLDVPPSLVGKWSLIQQGDKDQDGYYRWTFTDDTITVRVGRNDAFMSESPYKTRASKGFNEIDMFVGGLGSAPRTGIFKLEEQKLSIDFAMDSESRPSELRPDKIMVFERAAASKSALPIGDDAFSQQ